MRIYLVFSLLLNFQILSGFGSQAVFAKYPNRYFIESGSYCGEGIQQALNAGFQNVCSIELAPHYYQRCCDRFSSYSNVKLHQGDSADVLPLILEKIDQPATFWLDGHYSSGDTAKGSTFSPIMAELDCIAAHPIKTHTILIDDIRQCGCIEFDFVELEEIIQKILQINPNYTIVFEDGLFKNDILAAYIK